MKSTPTEREQGAELGQFAMVRGPAPLPHVRATGIRNHQYPHHHEKHNLGHPRQSTEEGGGEEGPPGCRGKTWGDPAESGLSALDLT